MDNNIDFQDQETRASIEEREEEEEAALSLCDFPLNSDELDKNDSSNLELRRSSSEPSDFFEFLNDLNSENYYMSHAEDIIFCGKLVPFQKQSLFDTQIFKSFSSAESCDINLPRRYCESLPELNPTRSNSSSSSSTRLSSRSLDSSKPRHRNTSLATKPKVSDLYRDFRKKNLMTPDGLNVKVSNKPRWYVMMFGLVKFPPEMDLRDIKNRQVRRSSGSMFSEMDGGGSDRRRSWGQGLLKVLSCKSHATVAVAASSGGIVT